MEIFIQILSERRSKRVKQGTLKDLYHLDKKDQMNKQPGWNLKQPAQTDGSHLQLFAKRKHKPWNPPTNKSM